MHCGVMVTGYNQGDWGRLMKEEYDRPPEVSDAENMDNTLYMGDLVEPLGFDSIWATEHYGSAYSMQPNPLQYLAFWAGRSNRVDMGTAVIVAPWWNPVRLAHEISMLDILLRAGVSTLVSAAASLPTNTLPSATRWSNPTNTSTMLSTQSRLPTAPSVSSSTARCTTSRRPPYGLRRDIKAT